MDVRNIPEKKLPILGIHQVLELLEKQGIDTGPLLRAAHIDRALLSDPTASIERAQELALVAALLKVHPDPCFGLQAGACYRLSAFGVLGSAVFAASTVREAIHFFIRFVNLSYTYFDVSVQAQPQPTEVVIKSRFDLGDLYPYFMQRDLAFAATAIQDISFDMAKNAIKSIDIALPEPQDPTPYQQGFRCPVRFTSGPSKIRYDSEILDRTLPMANPLSFKILEQQCEKDLQRLSRPLGVSETVRQCFLQTQGDYPDEAAIAKRLSITTRTLRRRLASEGSSYKQLLHQHLSSRARQLLLHTDLPVEQIALQCGYCESSSFIRAFKSWEAMTPTAFRKRSS